MAGRLRDTRGLAISWAAVGPACVGCTIPTFWHAAVAAGLLGTATWVHYGALAATPLIVVLLLRDWRVHRHPAVLHLTVIGTAAIAIHVGLHLSGQGHHSPDFNLSNQLGLALITMAVVMNTRTILRMRRRTPTPPASR